MGGMMEDRFIVIGYDMALASGYPMNGELVRQHAIHQWKYFVAECSEDYSKTRREQIEADRILNEYLMSRRTEIK